MINEVLSSVKSLKFIFHFIVVLPFLIFFFICNSFFLDSFSLASIKVPYILV